MTFNEVSESVDGLQIRVNLGNPKIKNSVVIIFDSNSSNLWRMIFQNPKKISKYHFSSLYVYHFSVSIVVTLEVTQGLRVRVPLMAYHFSFKSYSKLKYLGILLILGHSLIKCMGKHIEFTVELCERF